MDEWLIGVLLAIPGMMGTIMSGFKEAVQVGAHLAKFLPIKVRSHGDSGSDKILKVIWQQRNISQYSHTYTVSFQLLSKE